MVAKIQILHKYDQSVKLKIVNEEDYTRSLNILQILQNDLLFLHLSQNKNSFKTDMKNPYFIELFLLYISEIFNQAILQAL
ncbi:MAG: hypothetical protein HeimC3_07340 [Candidatus Heimdallarchaeota archaeon LC_3]|nr:MAG: hypothetical protein HeimC3_07340 [Candidatus Heimdallarchaeota archaeon LC_3]